MVVRAQAVGVADPELGAHARAGHERRVDAALHPRTEVVDQGAVEGVVESARPLDEAQIASIAEKIGRDLAAKGIQKVHLTNRTDESLVGGVRVFIGARMFDYSVKGRLDGLRQRLLEAPLPTPSA